MVGRQPQRGLAVQPGAGDVVLGLGAEAGQVHVRVGGVGGVAGERGEAAVGANGAGPVLRLVRGAGQRLERRQVVGLEAEQLVERLDRHLRRVVARGAGGGLGGEEGAGLLLLAAGERAEGEVALGGAGELSAALAHHRLDPEGGGGSSRGGERARRPRPAPARARPASATSSVSSRSAAKGCASVASPSCRYASRASASLPWATSSSASAKARAPSRASSSSSSGAEGGGRPPAAKRRRRPLDEHGGLGEPRLVERGHLVAAADRGRPRRGGAAAGGEAVGAAPLDLGQQLGERVLHRLEDDGRQPRGRRGGEAVAAARRRRRRRAARRRRRRRP